MQVTLETFTSHALAIGVWMQLPASSTSPKMQFLPSGQPVR